MDCFWVFLKAFAAGLIISPIALFVGLFFIAKNNQELAKRFITWLSDKVIK